MIDIDTVYRSVAYLRSSYSLFQLPMQFFSYLTTFYYLAVNNISWLKNIFPNFSDFIFVGLIVLLVMTLLGYLYRMKSELYKQEVKVNVMSNPYQTEKIVPNFVSLFEAIISIIDNEPFDTSELRKLVENSK